MNQCRLFFMSRAQITFFILFKAITVRSYFFSAVVTQYFARKLSLLPFSSFQLANIYVVQFPVGRFIYVCLFVWFFFCCFCSWVCLKLTHWVEEARVWHYYSLCVLLETRLARSDSGGLCFHVVSHYCWRRMSNTFSHISIFLLLVILIMYIILCTFSAYGAWKIGAADDDVESVFSCLSAWEQFSEMSLKAILKFILMPKNIWIFDFIEVKACNSIQKHEAEEEYGHLNVFYSAILSIIVLNGISLYGYYAVQWDVVMKCNLMKFSNSVANGGMATPRHGC